jgi:wyosine [tRNA(Phe)-imidazoG37] synthetase (radical SAM superfamily)
VPGAQVLRKLDLPQLREELDEMVTLATGGGLFENQKFSTTPPEYRRLNDIAMSGDGEPTSSPIFLEVVQLCADVRAAHSLDDVKLVLITNATMLQNPRVAAALEIFDANNGEIWGKLDAGTEDYYQRVDRTEVKLTEVMENLIVTARKRPIVIQSLFMRLDGEAPPPVEQQAYCDRLNEIVAAGGQIKHVQIHTIARKPAESFATPLENAEVDALAEVVRRRTGLHVESYYGS